ncbi:hypothetical protein JOM56_011867 [Amanita muscaria]
MTSGSDTSKNTRIPPATESSENTGGRAPLPVQEPNPTAISSDNNDTAPAKAPFHPSDIINASLLDEFPDAGVALTHDDDWMSVLNKGDPIPPANELYSRVKTAYNPVCDSGVAQLKPKESGEQSREGEN